MGIYKIRSTPPLHFHNYYDISVQFLRNSDRYGKRDGRKEREVVSETY